MAVGSKKIGEILLEVDFITKEQLNAALLHQKKNDPKKKLGEILVELGFLNEVDLLRCLAGIFKVRYISSDKLSKMTIPRWILDLVPLDFAESHCVFPFFCYDKTRILSVVIADPQDKELPKQLKKVSGNYEVERYLGLESTIRAAIERYYKDDLAAFDRVRPGGHPGKPTAIGTFVPKHEGAFDSEYKEPAEPGAEPKEAALAAAEQKAAAAAEERRRRLSDEVAAFSLMSEDTFIEVLHIVVTVLDGHKGKEYRGHSAGVAKMVKEVSRTLGLKARETYCNVLAAYLHDCCMSSPQHLTLMNFNGEDKSELLPKFARFSDRLFERAELPEEVKNILRHTFERHDGKGFPDGLKGEAIPLGSRLIAVVDAFMHLMAFEGEGSVRNRYREAFGRIKSFAGTRFAPEAVDALEEVVVEEFVDENSPRVIVVDSSSEERLFLVNKLKKSGIKAYMCRDTAEASDILQRDRVSLVLAETDTLPMDGFTFCSTVKGNENFRETSFILISNDPDAISKGFEAGADDFITKPYNPDILVAKIQNFIRLSAQKTAEQAKRLTSKKGISGNLSEIQIADLIQMLSAGRKTGVLKLVREGENGEMFFNNGEVINARYQTLDGVDAFNLLIRWDRGHFSLDPDGKPPEQKIYENTAMLLLEACRLWDEEKGAEG